MSLAALALVLGHAAMFGAVHGADEGTATHVWQLLMVGQIPIVVFFAIKWLLRLPYHISVLRPPPMRNSGIGATLSRSAALGNPTQREVEYLGIILRNTR